MNSAMEGFYGVDLEPLSLKCHCIFHMSLLTILKKKKKRKDTERKGNIKKKKVANQPSFSNFT